MTEAEHKRIVDRYGKARVSRRQLMGSRFIKISSGRLALKSGLDQVQIEALIREAIALLVESGRLQIPPTAASDAS